MVKNKTKQYLCSGLSGMAAGMANGLFGTGGGMLAVPFLKKAGLDSKQAHANAVAVILPLSVFSAVLYMKNGYVQLSDALPFIPAGIAGAATGTFLLKKISPSFLNRIFSLLTVYAGIRLLMK